MADSDTLTTALVNLLDNAYKYTEENKRISLRARADGGWVLFDVTDNGIGLSTRPADGFLSGFIRSIAKSRGAGADVGWD